MASINTDLALDRIL